MIQAVLFDVDDTLLDYSSAERAGIRGQLRTLGLPERQLAAAEEAWQEYTAHWVGKYLAGVITLKEQRRARARRMLAWLGSAVDRDDAAVDRWFDDYRSHHEAAIRPFDDALECLRRLGRYRLGVVSNNDPRYLRDKLGRAGLLSWFRTVVAVREPGWAKPRPEPFLQACAELDIQPGAAVYIGDSLETDAQAARAAGLHGVWLNRAGTPRATDVPVISTLREVHPLVTAHRPHADRLAYAAVRDAP